MSSPKPYDLTAIKENLPPDEHAQKFDRLCIVPKPFDRQHVRRQQVYDGLVDRLQASFSRYPTAVLYGPHGIGKSDIALDYALSLWRSSENISIIWINAGTEQRFIDGFKAVAIGAQLQGHGADVVDLLQLVKDWLEHEHKGKTLIIVDEADVNQAYFEEQRLEGKTFLEFIPRTSNAQVLYVTENRETAMKLDPGRRPLQIPPMSISEAELLLNSTSMPMSTRAERLELITKLNGSPFALNLAAAYMIRQKMSLADYLGLLAEPYSSNSGVSGQDDQGSSKEPEIEPVMSTCLRINYDAVGQESPRAAEILQIMSFMDHYSIPDCLLRATDETEADFDVAMGVLKTYALTTRIDRLDEPRFIVDEAALDFRMSSMLQSTSAAWVTKHIKAADSAALKAMDLVSTRFPYGWPDNWTICAKFLPHAKVLLIHSFKDIDLVAKGFRADLARKVSSFYRKQETSYEIAERLSLESKSISEDLYGCDETRTLDAYAEYSMVIQQKGRWEDAVGLERLVLEGREKLLGLDHPLTLESLNGLGFNLRQLGRYEEARVYAQRELEGKQRRVDSDPTDSNAQRDLTIAMTNIGYNYLREGKLQDAEAIFRSAAAREDIEGDDPRGYTTFDGLISALLSQDKLNEAEELCETIYPRRVRILGRTHRDTLTTRSDLAAIHASRGDPAKAETIRREVYNAQLGTLGKAHPVTLMTLHNLACSISDQDRPIEAVALMRQILRMQEEHVGFMMKETMATRRNLSIDLMNLGDFVEAESLIRENIALSEKRGEDQEGELLKNVILLVEVLCKQSKWEEAEKQSHRQLEISIKRHGQEHLDTKCGYDNLMHALDEQGKRKEAEDYARMSLEISVSMYGWEHKQTLRALWNIALVHRDLRNFEAAESEFEKLVDVKSKLYGKEDAQTIESGVQLAWVLQQAKKWSQSEYHYRWLREAQIKINGEDDPLVMLMTNNLASVLNYQGTLEESLLLFHKAYEGRKRLHGPRAPLTLKSMWTLAGVLEENGRVEEAEEWYEKYDLASRPDDPIEDRPPHVVTTSTHALVARSEVDEENEDFKGKGKKNR